MGVRRPDVVKGVFRPADASPDNPTETGSERKLELAAPNRPVSNPGVEMEVVINDCIVALSPVVEAATRSFILFQTTGGTPAASNPSFNSCNTTLVPNTDMLPEPDEVPAHSETSASPPATHTNLHFVESVSTPCVSACV